ncbi:MAG TPA: chalcone isomerase family protein [Malonomonas sp.]
MKRFSMRLKTGGLISLAVFLFVSHAPAIEVGGVTFADRYPLEKTNLRLTGAAVLKWALWFDVYAGAFYLPERVAGKDWTEDVPKRLELSYFRNFKAEDFTTTSDKLLRNNLSAEDYRSVEKRLQEFYQLFRDINPGDRYSLTYQAAGGTELRLNDELLGAAPGADFAVAYFGIWLGPQPISESFRDRLLKGG